MTGVGGMVAGDSTVCVEEVGSGCEEANGWQPDWRHCCNQFSSNCISECKLLDGSISKVRRLVLFEGMHVKTLDMKLTDSTDVQGGICEPVMFGGSGSCGNRDM